VCTGSFELAAAGILDGIPATSNKLFFDELSVRYPLVQWNRSARYVSATRSDGVRVITSSGVSAGVDMGFHLASLIFGQDVIKRVAEEMCYEPLDKDTDPFAEVHKRKSWLESVVRSKVMDVMSHRIVSSQIDPVLARPALSLDGSVQPPSSWLPWGGSPAVRPLILLVLPTGFALYDLGLGAECLGATDANLSLDLASFPSSSSSSPASNSTTSAPRVAGRCTGGDGSVTISTHRILDLDSSQDGKATGWPHPSENLAAVFVLSSLSPSETETQQTAAAIRKAMSDKVRYIVACGPSGLAALRIADPSLSFAATANPEWKDVGSSRIGHARGSGVATAALDIVAGLRDRRTARWVATQAELALEHVRLDAKM
jgi:transcriptional regulator GlxA family with amidase domain